MQAELPEGFVKHDICVIIYIHVKVRRVYRKEEKQKMDHSSLSQSLPSLSTTRVKEAETLPVRGIMRVKTLNESLELMRKEATADGNSRSCLRQPRHSHRAPRRNTWSSVSRTVNFNNVDIREYERVIGDNPSCSGGAPIR